MKERPREPRSGVVTFLDVLGWKGVYDRKQDAIASLKLTADVVTGKLDVREAAAKLPDPEEVSATEAEAQEVEPEMEEVE